MASLELIPFSDEENEELGLGSYAANAATATPIGGAIANEEIIPFTGSELIDVVESDINRQLGTSEFERYRRAKFAQPDKTLNEKLDLIGQGAGMAAEEFFGGIASAVSQGMYIADPLKGLKTVASGFARGGVDMFTIIEDIFTKDFHAADTYEQFLEDMELEDDKSSREIYVERLNKDKVRFNLKRAFMSEREKWRKGETKTILPLIGEIEGEDVKGAEAVGYVGDFTAAVPIAGAFSRLPKFAAKGAGLVGSTGGKIVGGTGRTILKGTDAVADKVGKIIPDAATTTTRVATIAGAGVTGQPLIGAAMALPEVGKTLDVAGRLSQKVSEELGKRPSQFGVLERVAMNSSVDPTLRKLARILHAGGVGDKLLSGSGSLALGVGTGMAVGGTLGGLAQGEEGFFQGLGAGMVVGGPASLAGSGLSKLTGHARRSAEDADIMRFLESQAEKGVDPKQAMAKLKRDGLLKIATLTQIFQGDVNVNLLDNASYAKAHSAGAASWNKNTRTIDINMDADGAKRNVLHEFGHAIFDSPIVNKNGILSELRGVYGQKKLDAMSDLYAQALTENRFRNQYFKKDPSSKSANNAVAAWKEGRIIKNAKGETIKTTDYDISIGMEKGELARAHGIDWIVSEIFAEDFVGATIDRNINKIRKGQTGDGLFHLRGHILKAKANVLSRMGVKINDHGIVDGKYASRLFGEMTGDKKFKKTIRNYIRDRGRHFDEMGKRSRKKDGAGPKEDIRNMGDHAGFWRDKGDGTFENDFATKNTKGEITIKDPETIAKALHDRAEGVRNLREGLVAKGLIGRDDKTGFGARTNEKGDIEVTGKVIPDDVIEGSNLPPQMKEQLKVLNDLVQNSGTAMVWYNGISTTKKGNMRDVIKSHKDGTPDLRGTTRMWRRNLRKFMGNIAASRREIKPVGYTITKEGNITVELLDVDAIHDKVARWQKDNDSNSRPKLELWGNDIKKFYEDMKIYMDNHRKGLGGSEGIGEAKRNAFRAFFLRDMLGSGGVSPMHDILNNRPLDRTSMVKSFRLDRIGSVESTFRDDFHFDYYKVKENLMPDGTPKVREHGQTVEFNEAMIERFMPVAPEGARYMDLRDMQQEKMVALSIDRLGHGIRTLQSGATTELSAQGGRAFMWLNNKWASYREAPFKALYKALKDVGTEYIALTTLGELNHNNTRSGMRYFGESLRDAVKRGDITKKQADAYIETMTSQTATLGGMKKKTLEEQRQHLKDIRTVEHFINAVDEGLITHKSGEQIALKRNQVGDTLQFKRTEAEELGFGPTSTARMAVDSGLWDESKFPVGTVVAVMKVKPDTNIIHEPGTHYHYPYTIVVEPVAYLKEFYPLSSLSSGRSRVDPKEGKKRGNVFDDKGNVYPQPLQAILPETDKLTAGKMGPPIDHPVNFMPDVPQGAYSRSAGDMLPSKGIDSIGRHIPNWKSARVYHSTDKEGLNSIRKEGYKVVGDGYYGDAVSVTPDLNYSKQFGGFITTAKVKDNANILNLNDPKDSDKWMEITKGVSGPDYRKVAMRNGIDGIYDPGAGDLFVYNPSKLEYLGEGMVGGADKGYTSLTLNTDSQNALTKALDIPEGWDVKAHHMTINMGSPELGPGVNLLSQTAGLQATMVAKNDKVMAVKVDSSVPSSNKTPHVTVAVNTKAGGKPVMSNNFKDSDYKPLYPPIDLEGRITHEGIQGADPHPVNYMPETHWSNRDPVMESARKAGVSGEAWDKLVELRKPVTMAPKPDKRDLLPDTGPTTQEVNASAKKFKKGDKPLKTSLNMLNENQRKLIGATRQTPEGTRVGVRLDIPFFQNTLKKFKDGILDKVGYAITIHEQGTEGGVGRAMGYDTIARVRNAVFHVAKGVSTKNDIEGVAAGTRSKFPNATVEGEYVSIHDKNGKLNNDAIPYDIYDTDKWIQVGFDPRRHEYFYRKDNTSVPIETASEAILVGNTAFVRVDDALVQGDRSQHRYMPAQTSKLESDYMDAAAREDVDAMQPLVDQAAARAGYDSPTVYHGSVEKNLNRLDPKKALEVEGAIFFSTNEDVAHQYTFERAYGDIISEEPLGDITTAKLKMDNPLRYKSKGPIVDAVEMQRVVDDAKASQHDGVIINNIDDSIGMTGDMGDVHVVFNPNQIKSADPVTFDDNGNVIPLHDRFDMESDDIRHIPAYHGTPHTFSAEEGAPLGKFSTDKIGTGEGAQAYGHGLYFAEKKSVAEWYRDKLGNKIDVDNISVNMKINDKQVNKNPKFSVANGLAFTWFNQDGKIASKADAMEAAVNRVESEVGRWVIGRATERLGQTTSKELAMFKAEEYIESAQKVLINKLLDFKDNLAEAKRNGDDTTEILNKIAKYELAKEVFGDVYYTMDFDIDTPVKQKSLYEVDITPKEEHFLDLDKTFEEQSKYVKDAFKKGYQKLLEGHPYMDETDYANAAALVDDFMGNYDIKNSSNNFKALSLIKLLENHTRKEDVSAGLASIGIAGNRFQDAPSRAAINLGKPKEGFKPTRNYVVFEDSAVEIKNRYMPRVSEDGKVVTIPTKGRIVQTGSNKLRVYNIEGKLLGVAGSQGAADALLNRGKN